MKLNIFKQIDIYPHHFTDILELEKFQVEINYYFSYNQMLIYKR